MEALPISEGQDHLRKVQWAEDESRVTSNPAITLDAWTVSTTHMANN